MKKHPEITIYDSLLDTLTAIEWHRTLDDEDRAWLLLLDLADRLHPLGPIVIPSRGQITRLLARLERDDDIAAGFDGRNYHALAREHRLTTRQVRRIVERVRQMQRRTIDLTR